MPISGQEAAAVAAVAAAVEVSLEPGGREGMRGDLNGKAAKSFGKVEIKIKALDLGRRASVASYPPLQSNILIQLKWNCTSKLSKI